MSDKNSKPISEEKTTSASYIINFYTVVQQLNNHYANYVNMLIYIEKTVGASSDKLQPEHRTELINLVQNIRYYATQAYIGYSTIMIGIGKPKDEAIEKNYQKLLEDLIISRDVVYKFVVSMNSSLMTDIVKRLLETAQDIVKDLVSNDQPN